MGEHYPACEKHMERNALTCICEALSEHADLMVAARLAEIAELLHRQRVLHANLVAPTHPNAPVLIQVDQVLALIEEVQHD